MESGSAPSLARQHQLAMLERAWWGRLALLCLLALLGIAALLLAARRLSGGLVRPLDLATLLLVAMVAALVALSVRVLWHRLIKDSSLPFHQLTVRWGPTLLLVVLGFALSLPGTRLEALVLFWVIFLGEELWAVQFLSRTLSPQRAVPMSVTSFTSLPVISPLPTTPAGTEAAARDELSGAEPTEQEQVLLRLTRVRRGEGQEVLHATFRVDFQAGQRTAAFHLAFCPPFAFTPEMDAFQIDGPEARLKVSQLLPYGARFDLRLNQAHHEPTAIEIEAIAVGEMLPTG